ncbi:MAG: UDP-N-acetylmuramoyl-tripeptide--D-alanyl-D-alanine ligase, partial [Bacilli bacterium]
PICLFNNYLFIGMLGYFNYFIVLLACFINTPVEKGVYNYYKRLALKKLKGTNLDVIGITGSYGKTSSKNILFNILNVKYNVLATPKNFNTAYGLIGTINKNLDKFTELFIAEMGAFKKGEIKQLCDLVKPKYGILTTIGTAHLESFGSRKNIQKGKFELIESLPSDGVGILNMDDPYQVSYKIKNSCKIIWIGIDSEADVVATDIVLTNKGTTFNVMFKGDKTKYKFETVLLGKANIYNILDGIALGKYLNISIEQLQLGVKKVQILEHRLELKKYGEINIIDDAYNSNPIGSKMALEVLALMPGKKIVVTPGMIELGSNQYEANKDFGKQIAHVADEVILVGQQQTKPIYDGLKEEKYDNIHIIEDVKEAFILMNKLKEKETYVLLENDLPDIFL